MGGSAPPSKVSIKFSQQTQEQSNWCWAAVTASVNRYHDSASTILQCEIVNLELGLTKCCDDGACADCDKEWRLSSALTRTKNLGRMEVRAARYDEIRDELVGKRPMCARIEWSGGNGHFVVISGCEERAAEHFVTVEDPISGTNIYPLEEFVDRYEGTGRCSHSYWTV